MKLYSVFDPEFRNYGRVVSGFDTESFLQILARRECPEGVVYEPSDPELEALPEAACIQQNLFGRIPIQIGYTNGHCKKMNALEYHKSSEFNAADQDVIMFLALRQEANDDFTVDTRQVKAFLLPRGVLIELYATTLHYAPCQTSQEGYRCIVVLPKGTNLPIAPDPQAKGESRLITAVNKWLIGHPDGQLDPDAFLGLTGENLTIDMIE